MPRDPEGGIKSAPRPVVSVPAHCQASNVDVENDTLHEIAR